MHKSDSGDNKGVRAIMMGAWRDGSALLAHAARVASTVTSSRATVNFICIKGILYCTSAEFIRLALNTDVWVYTID